MQGARRDAVRALLAVGNTAARRWWKLEIARIYWRLLSQCGSPPCGAHNRWRERAPAGCII